MSRLQDALALLAAEQRENKKLREINSELRAALKWAGEIIKEAQEDQRKAEAAE